MFDEILKSIRSQLYERAVSPLFGSVLISWGIWNYKFVLLVFSGIAITEKYSLIDEVLFSNWQQIYLRGALYPFLTAIFYIFVYPYPAKYVFAFSRNRQKEINDIKHRIEEETLLTVKESRAIRGEIFALEEEHQKEVKRKDNEIFRLREELENAPISVEHVGSDSADELPEKDDDLTDAQAQILKEIGESDSAVSKKRIVSQASSGHVKAKYDLGELQTLGYLERDYSSGVHGYYAQRPRFSG